MCNLACRVVGLPQHADVTDGGGGQGQPLLPGLVFHVSKTKERTATTSTVKLKNCMQEAAKKSAKRQQNAFKHTARQGKRGVARGKGNHKNDPGPTFFSMKKKYIFSV
jgi:hypothetical protein